jgi:hypothetical protein
VALTPIWLESSDHFFISAANPTFNSECNSVLDVEIANLECVGIAKRQAACNSCGPHADAWNCLKLLGGNVGGGVTGGHSGEIVEVSCDIAQCVRTLAFNSKFVKGVIRQRRNNSR